ncbi:hypothetical protein E2C01_011296 [Portunus trituberculatus]|uniref:Uncharacterized protein n=1 Tax=Portunus trituberculatus TaxID=210409 RepID=A0A5B7DB10_PORTR|nr:hypothetical protein [Portunus trituberculatus]
MGSDPDHWAAFARQGSMSIIDNLPKEKESAGFERGLLWFLTERKSCLGRHFELVRWWYHFRAQT